MGKGSKDFGLGNKGKIGIALEKQHFIAGELVSGTIYVEIYEPIQCNALVLKASGKEKVEWEEVETDSDGNSSTQEFEKKKEFFKDKIIIHSVPATYYPGSYQYPFQYQLPSGLPGVFSMSEYNSGSVQDLKAKIQYKLKATLDVEGYYAKDIKADCHLVVHSQLFDTIRPSEDSTTQDVNFLCCFSKGTCQLSVAMDKNVYLPGETAQIFCNIQNNSSVEISRMRCRLYQDLALSVSDDGFYRNFVFTRELCANDFPGVPPGQNVSQPQPLLLGGPDMNPSTTGNYIQCSYHIDVECDIPWCPDVELHLPVIISAPYIPSNMWLPEDPSQFH